MIPLLKRLTTEFVDAEDRLRLSGEIENASPVALWLTQRLALRLLTPLFRWLDHQSGAPSAMADMSSGRPAVANVQTQVIHSFAQEAAMAQFKPQPPVQRGPAGESWLVHSIDLTPAEQGLALVFRAVDGRAAGLSFGTVELRQWLAILNANWIVAQWPPAAWPDWMQGEARPAGQQILLH